MHSFMLGMKALKYIIDSTYVGGFNHGRKFTHIEDK